MLSRGFLSLLEEGYCPINGSEIRDGCGGSYEWTKARILKGKLLYISFPDSTFYIEFAYNALQKYKLS